MSKVSQSGLGNVLWIQQFMVKLPFKKCASVSAIEYLQIKLLNFYICSVNYFK